MSFFVMFLIWYNLWGKNNPKVYRKIGNSFGKIITAFILFSVFTSFIPGFLVNTLAAVIVASIFLGPPALIVSVIMKLLGKDKKRDRRNDYDYYQNNYHASAGDSKRVFGTSVTGLTRSVAKRRKIVEKFNKKNNLNLTDSEIGRIVDASYMSNCWEREIYDMSLEYDSLFQWYNGDSSWLRAYLHAFPVQSVSSDFEMQHQICLDAFIQIFEDIRPGTYTRIDDCIAAINNRYYTAFDETTFMIAYRFLEANGRRYEMPHLRAMHSESELDSLKRKYDETQDANVYADRARTRI